MYLPILLLAAAVSTVVAAPAPALLQRQTTCSTGVLDCCQTVVEAASEEAQNIIVALGIKIPTTLAADLVGITCKYRTWNALAVLCQLVSSA